PSISLIIFQESAHHRVLHSFPTRRSSDLWRATVSTRARLGPPEPGAAAIAVAAPLDPPTVASTPGLVLEAAEHVRNRLRAAVDPDRKSTRLNSSHVSISYAVFCLKKKTKT